MLAAAACLAARHQPIMLIFPPIMLCCSAQNFDLLCYAAVLKILTYYAQYYQGRSQTSSDGRAQRFYNIAIVIYCYTGSYVH